MSGYLTEKTDAELARARKIRRIGGYVALVSLLPVIVAILFFQLFQIRLPEYLISITGSGVLLGVGLAMLGTSTIIENWEARRYKGSGTVYNPFSVGMRQTAWWILVLFAPGVLVAGIIFYVQGK